MLAKTAYELINIESDVDYIENMNVKDGPIFRIHCVKTNQEPVFIQSYKGFMIEFPANSFICGAVYDIMIKRMKFNKNTAAFVGYRLKDKPANMRN